MIDWIIAFVGVVAGYYLGKIAKEELKKGKKFLVIIRERLFFITILTSIFYMKNASYSLLVPVLAILYYKIPRKEVAYLLFIPLYFVLQPNSVITSLIFMFGLPAGALIYEKRS